MSNVALSLSKDGSDGLTHNVRRGRKGTQDGIGRILGYQGLFLGRLPGDHFNILKSLTSSVSRIQMTGIALNLFTPNMYYPCTIPVGVKSKQFLPNLPDGRGHSLGGGGGWGRMFMFM